MPLRSEAKGTGRVSRTPRTGRSLTAVLAACTVLIPLLCCSGGALANEPGAGAPGFLDLTLADSIRLVLKNNRKLINARLDRTVDKFSLRVEENKFRPHVTVGPYIGRTYPDGASGTGTAAATSKVTLRIPTGGELSADWSGGHRVGRDSPYFNELTFAFTQPLLRGAGVEINTASIREARLAEEINVLSLKQTIIDIVSSVIRSYRGYMQAQRRVEIRGKSLERARELLAVNELLIETGRMARRDIVQTKADIADRELRLIAAQNSLDAARLALIDILDVDSRTRLRLSDTLDVEPKRTDLARSLETALQHRPDYRQALLGLESAETRLAVADNGRSWDLSVTLSANFSHADKTLDDAVGRLDNTDYGIGLNLGFPIGPAAADPRELAYVRAATALKRTRNSLADLRQRIDIEVGNAVRETELLLRQIDLARSARQLVERKAEIEREKLRLGLTSNFRLVAFEDDLVAAENNELDSIIAYLNALTALDQRLGTTLETWDLEIGGPDSASDP